MFTHTHTHTHTHTKHTQSHLNNNKGRKQNPHTTLVIVMLQVGRVLQRQVLDAATISVKNNLTEKLQQWAKQDIF